MRRPSPANLKTLRVLARPGQRARGWLVAGPLRFSCALGPAGIVRRKREGDGATPADRLTRPECGRPPGSLAARR
jgi:L,D-peptidoglycan transpeptidase YkuD (ErfK/YbiS/YcfS/YnhG family)